MICETFYKDAEVNGNPTTRILYLLAPKHYMQTYGHVMLELTKDICFIHIHIYGLKNKTQFKTFYKDLQGIVQNEVIDKYNFKVLFSAAPDGHIFKSFNRMGLDWKDAGPAEDTGLNVYYTTLENFKRIT